MKKFLELKIGHGWFNGYARETDTISTIDSGMSKWHILLVELAEDNEITQREREFLSRIIQNLVSFMPRMAMA